MLLPFYMLSGRVFRIHSLTNTPSGANYDVVFKTFMKRIKRLGWLFARASWGIIKSPIIHVLWEFCVLYALWFQRTPDTHSTWVGARVHPPHTLFHVSGGTCSPSAHTIPREWGHVFTLRTHYSTWVGARVHPPHTLFHVSGGTCSPSAHTVPREWGHVFTLRTHCSTWVGARVHPPHTLFHNSTL